MSAILNSSMLFVLSAALVGCGDGSAKAKVSGEVSVTLTNGENLRLAQVEIQLIDRRVADALFAKTNLAAGHAWTKRMWILSFLAEVNRDMANQEFNPYIGNLPPDSEAAKFIRQVDEIFLKNIENAKQRLAEETADLQACYGLLRQATLKSVHSDSNGYFSFTVSQPTTNLALFAKTQRILNGKTEEYAWLLPLLNTNDQRIVLSDLNLLSKKDAFAERYGEQKAATVNESKQTDQSAEIASLKARLSEMESAIKKESVKQSADPVAQLRKALQRINDPDWSVITYDVRKTDSLVSPMLAIIDLRLTVSSNIVYTAYVVYQNDLWVLKTLEKSFDRDGSLPGRTKEVVAEDYWPWHSIQRLLREAASP